MPANNYSQRWFDLFMSRLDPAQTRREALFLQACLPLPAYPRIVDVCCGTGRHARELAAAGYHVTAIDRDVAALEKARRTTPPRAPGGRLRQMRNIARAAGVDPKVCGASGGSVTAAESSWRAAAGGSVSTSAILPSELRGGG